MTTNGLEIVNLMLSFLAFFLYLFLFKLCLLCTEGQCAQQQGFGFYIYFIGNFFFSVNISNDHQMQNYWLKNIMNGFT